MDMVWVYGVMVKNARLIDAENRFANQIAHIFEMSDRGEDTSSQEDVLSAYWLINVELREACAACFRG